MMRVAGVHTCMVVALTISIEVAHCGRTWGLLVEDPSTVLVAGPRTSRVVVDPLLDSYGLVEGCPTCRAAGQNENHAIQVLEVVACAAENDHVDVGI